MDKFESSIEEIGEIVTDGERREREREREREEGRVFLTRMRR